MELSDKNATDEYPPTYDAEYKAKLLELGIVLLPDDDPYRLRYGCNTTSDKHIVMAALANIAAACAKANEPAGESPE